MPSSNGYFGDPCGGTYKYLNISYNCVNPSAEEDAKAEESAADLQAALAQAQANVETNKGATVCEHKTLDIECGTGTVAKINSATYGRLKNGVCGNGSNTTCAARDGKYCGHGKNQQCQTLSASLERSAKAFNRAKSGLRMVFLATRAGEPSNT